jgi:hypothetical protein
MFIRMNINKCKVVLNSNDENDKENLNTINLVRSSCIKQVPHIINEKTNRDEKINKVNFNLLIITLHNLPFNSIFFSLFFLSFFSKILFFSFLNVSLDIKFETGDKQLPALGHERKSSDSPYLSFALFPETFNAHGKHLQFASDGEPC